MPDREELREQKARALLDAVLDKFVVDVRECIQYKINDSINVDDILGPNNVAQDIMLRWVQRMLYETVRDDLGETHVASFFDSAFFQICGQQLGPEDFSRIAKPYRK